VRDLVYRLTRARNWITLLVSHHQDDIAALATRRYVLADGELGLVE
jgi:thiamine transport system ATP-binding protein